MPTRYDQRISRRFSDSCGERFTGPSSRSSARTDDRPAQRTLRDDTEFNLDVDQRM